jgi:3-hydroxyisobutyrate dehydrogenase
MKIAFLGTGLMGAPMANRLLSAGYELTVYNRTKAKAIFLETKGAHIGQNPAAAIGDCDVIITMLADYKAVTDVLLKDKSVGFKGRTVIQMSTISPKESINVKNKIEESGGEYLEAPVLGSVPQVEAGALFILVGGSKEQFDKWQHLLKNFGKDVILIGNVGDAAATKLALNQLIASLISAFSMSLGYLREKEVDIESFMNILRKSALYAPTFDRKLANMLNRDFNNPNFPLKHMLKDVKLILSEFGSQKIDTSPINGVEEILQKAVDDRMDELDYSAMYNIIHKQK